MSTSDKSFNQVRAILNKLDRSIDEARERRLQPAPAPAPVPQQASSSVISKPAPAPNNASTSQYGRAQPLQRPQANNGMRWNP